MDQSYGVNIQQKNLSYLTGLFINIEELYLSIFSIFSTNTAL